MLKYQQSITTKASRPRHGALAKLVAGISLLLLPSACQTSSSALKIGTLLPITGDLSQFGSPMQDSASLLVKTVNGCGGVLGKPVELISEDDQTQPAAGATAMSKLAEVNRVGGVVGAAGSAVSSAAVDIAVRNQVVQISPASTSPIFTERAKKGDFKGFWFRTAPPDTFQGQALAKLAKAKGYKSVAVLAINNDYGNGLVQSFIPAFEALGGKVVNRDKPTRYAPNASTFESEVGAAFGGKPNAVLLIAYPETGTLILKAAYQQGLLGKQTQVLVTEGMKEAKVAQLVGKNTAGQYIAAGIIGTAPNATGPALAAFRDRYQTTYKRQPGVYDPNSWDAAAVLVLAAEAAKSPTGAAIQEKILSVANQPGQEVGDVCQALSLIREGKDINYQGASGNVDFDVQGDVTGSYDVWTIDTAGNLKVTDLITVGGS
ncbi:ABC transporter substrate-binding protein [Argonema galeatum]|uniref:ABC transporter substrate-binding protein n=1 Tax=Argonema galeatum TaxID=2942762 RepID=UPI0020129519|nr:ABC transporter substrate-binding protein [Argonema galeatum]MCL1464488.1 ABC transporter substrate-binding protein [Argonema galeatum A003/A1]